MATHPHDFGRASALSLHALLASIPSLPRPLLARLTARLIEHMDDMDGDPDLEDDTEDRCPAGDDNVTSGATHYGYGLREAPRGGAGDEIDEEPESIAPGPRPQHVHYLRGSRCYRLTDPSRKVDYSLRRWPCVPSKRQLLTRKRGVPRRPRA